MTPELEKALARIDFLEQEVKRLSDFVEEKKRQQISYPLDDASRNIISNIV